MLHLPNEIYSNSLLRLCNIDEVMELEAAVEIEILTWHSSLNQEQHQYQQSPRQIKVTESTEISNRERTQSTKADYASI